MYTFAQDRLATSCRLAIATSIVGGYPLVFLPARTGAFNLFGYKVTVFVNCLVISTSSDEGKGGRETGDRSHAGRVYPICFSFCFT